MKTRVIPLVIVAVLTSVSGAAAFNGNRAGFVIGGGMGVAPVVYWSNDDQSGNHDQGAGLDFDFMIGYGWNANNLLVWELDLASFNHDFEGMDATIIQGFQGPSWYRYIGPPGKAVFLTVGLGITHFISCLDERDECYSNGAGQCLRLGAGHEFGRHFQAGVTWSNGLTFDGGEGNNYTHSTLNVLVTGVAF